MKADAARVVPLIVAMSQAIYALAPALFGVARAISDPSLLVLAVVIQCLAIAAYLYGRHR